MELSCVGSGYAVVRCKGLYEAKLTLVPTLPVPPNSEPSSPKAGAFNPVIIFPCTTEQACLCLSRLCFPALNDCPAKQVGFLIFILSALQNRYAGAQAACASQL